VCGTGAPHRRPITRPELRAELLTAAFTGVILSRRAGAFPHLAAAIPELLTLLQDLLNVERESMNFVLVHGGWQGGWTWDAVVPALTSRGHTAYAPTLRGMAEYDTGRADVTVTDMADGLAADLARRDVHDVVLVGHSGGGPVAQLVAERLGDRVRRIVFMSAWVLKDGESINDIKPQHEAAAVRAGARRTTDNTVPIDPGRWASKFMQDATPQQLAAVTSRLVPSPLGWFDQRVRLPRFFGLNLPASYIFLRHDLAAPRERYQQMAGRLGNPLIIECDGSHQAMQTQPEAVADALIAAAGNGS
jgi:pimeloyl-ACP methyl ester carboxylesterase